MRPWRWTVNALEKKWVGYELTAGGAGYTTPPTVSVPGVEGAPARVELAFGADLARNGSVSVISLPKEK